MYLKEETRQMDKVWEDMYMATNLNVAMLMLDLKCAEERAEVEGWIDADDLEKELGIHD